MNWVLIFLGFSLLIILHEAGHFFAAKATGMRVERFFLFFPPKLVSIKRGETEYGIGAIPRGGFVKISGMNPDEELPPEAEGRGYYDQPVWKRIVVIGAGPGGQHRPRLRDPLRRLLAERRAAATRPSARSSRDTPAAASLGAGRRIVAVDGKGYPSLDAKSGSNASASRSPPIDARASRSTAAWPRRR